MENLTLDFNNFGSRAALGTYEKCDSLTLTIVLDEKDYTGYKFKIVAKKSDGHIIEQDIKEQDINREEKIIKTELNNQFTTKEGVVKLEINMIKDGKEDTTKEAFFIVRDTINGEVVESTSIIPTLEGVKAFIDEAVISLGDLEQAGEDIALINGEFKEAEIKRKANELLRERSEKERVRLESIRTTEEADRIKAEAERKEAENNRKVAESNRKLAENTRKTNEAARVEAELNRQSLFEENEEIRNENENLRIEAEKERKLAFSNNNKFESERVEAEKLRAIAEDKRVTAEKARAKAEEERVKAETRRENTYTDFNDSEVERRNNEANRVRAEAERVNAESGRNELFNTNEEKRNSTFIESERTRERAFNEAQSNRNEAYEESDRVREEAFKVSEVARNEAEEGRVAAEVLRVEAEKLRVAGEENRNNTFTQSEEERKSIFEEAENARKVAESKRVAAETGRGEAEKLRVTAETERVEAENLRATAEEERVAAETKREEGFNEFEGRISANIEELKNARSATTGEKFDTLDERIDCEVDRLNKKIEVSFLQQEDKENHVIENTVEGMTTDMIIKGRTLQNIIKTETFGNAQICSYELRDGYYNITELTNPPNKGAMVFDLKLSKKIIAGNTYTCIVLDKSISNKYLLRDNINSENITSVISGNVFTFTPKKESDFVLLYYYDIVVGDKIKENQNIVILEGDWTNKPVPEYFEGIKSFGQEEGKIVESSHGKNLFNINNIEIKTDSIIKSGNGYILKNYSNNTNKKVEDLFPFLRAGKTYTFSFDFDYKGNSQVGASATISFYDFTSSSLVKSIYNGDELTITSDMLKTYVFLYGVTTGETHISNIQVEEGSIKSEYELYKGDKKEIQLPKYSFEEGLRGLNSSVYDELNSIRGVAIKRVEKKVLNGDNEGWGVWTNSTGDVINAYVYFNDVIPSLKGRVKPDSICLNDRLPSNQGGHLSTTEGFKITSTYFTLSIHKSKLGVENVNDPNNTTALKNWLKQNPVTVYYELAQPVETPLTDPINVKTFNEKTYVSFLNSLKGTSNFKAPVNAAATISRLNRENRALEEENAKLKADTYKNAEDIIITNEELQITQSAVDHLLFSNLNASGTAMLYNGKKKGGGSMGAYLAMRIIKGKLKYEAVMKQYGEFKEDIDLILEAEGYGQLITQQ